MFAWFGVAIIARLLSFVTPIDNLVVFIPVTIATTVVVSMTTLGMFRNAIAAADEKRPNVTRLFMLQGLIWYLLVSAISTALVVVGLAIFVIPGVVIGGYWLLFPYLIADRNQPWLSSLRDSWRLVRGSWFYIVKTWLATYVVMGIAGLLTFGLAFFVTVPWTLIVHAQVYRRLLAAHQSQHSEVQPTPLAAPNPGARRDQRRRLLPLSYS